MDGLPSSLSGLALDEERGVLELPPLVALFLLDQFSIEHEYDFDSLNGGNWLHALERNRINVGKVSVYDSVTVHFVSPTDPEGRRGGQLKEIIRVNPSYRGHARYDCVLVETDEERPGMLGLHAAQVRLAFSCRANGRVFPCVLVHWFRRISDTPDRDTGMWIVEPELCEDQSPSLAVLHIDCIFRAAHLLLVFGEEPVPEGIDFTDSLQIYRRFFVNPYADHHMHEILYDPDMVDGLDRAMEH